jgi:hypothetical protein
VTAWVTASNSPRRASKEVFSATQATLVRPFGVSNRASHERISPARRGVWRQLEVADDDRAAHAGMLEWDKADDLVESRQRGADEVGPFQLLPHLVHDIVLAGVLDHP